MLRYVVSTGLVAIAVSMYSEHRHKYRVKYICDDISAKCSGMLPESQFCVTMHRVEGLEQSDKLRILQELSPKGLHVHLSPWRWSNIATVTVRPEPVNDTDTIVKDVKSILHGGCPVWLTEVYLPFEIPDGSMLSDVLEKEGIGCKIHIDNYCTRLSVWRIDED